MRSDGELLCCVDSVKTFPALGLKMRKSPASCELSQTG